MGLSRNKVAVSEGAAGSPPFYGDRDRFSRICHTSQDETGTQVRKLLLFNFQGSGKILEKRRAREYGGVAQLGEHLPCKQGVMGSNPIISTIPGNRDTERWEESAKRERFVAQVVRARA